MSTISKKIGVTDAEQSKNILNDRKVMTVPDFRARKGTQPLVCLTAYTAHVAHLVDAEADMILVGDSLGMVIHGMPNTLGVTIEHMIMHGQAVVRGAQKALVVVDMPFGSYEESPEVAFRNASRIIKETGCTAVKLEGGQEMASTIQHLAARGIPVMAHVGLMPQQMNTAGGFKAVRDEDSWQAVILDAKAVEAAGAFSVVIEGVAEELAQKITKSIQIPTIGIGA
ncbi:3-methyl-2-oxobutanoate hydroxymethyltransferase, partial [Amylibacter sp.]|nr:3-methyl-2-oxobutanoate hydroxymethyltransferase [Amylibacter sp.]